MGLADILTYMLDDPDNTLQMRPVMSTSTGAPSRRVTATSSNRSVPDSSGVVLCDLTGDKPPENPPPTYQQVQTSRGQSTVHQSQSGVITVQPSSVQHTSPSSGQLTSPTSSNQNQGQSSSGHSSTRQRQHQSPSPPLGHGLHLSPDEDEDQEEPPGLSPEVRAALIELCRQQQPGKIVLYKIF